ncbi:MAG: hypothetical protein RMX65_014305 [Nostoc sp. DedQUE01]
MSSWNSDRCGNRGGSDLELVIARARVTIYQGNLEVTSELDKPQKTVETR